VGVVHEHPGAPQRLRMLGRYQLLRRLAVGGMGELYLARARSIGGFEKLAAIKRILPHLAAQPEFVEMFLDEARVAATLEHPNIVHVSDLGHVDDEYFLVMPFLEGADLSTLRRRLVELGRTLPWPLAVFVASGIAAGLDYAHAKRDRGGRPMGVVHRDVSPENVFVTFEGEVKLLDFGIAKAAQVVSRTDVGTRRGKARYMSPEQAQGLPLDGRSDIFSLGVVLYELTTGQTPFRGDDDLAILNKVVTQDVTPPSRIVARYPGALERVVLTALSRDPARRFQRADDMRAALDAFAREQRMQASAVELGAFLIEVLGARPGLEADDVAGVAASPVPPPPVSGALLVDRARAPRAASAEPRDRIEPTPIGSATPIGEPASVAGSRWPWVVGTVGLGLLAAAAATTWRADDPVEPPIASSTSTVERGAAGRPVEGGAGQPSPEQLVAVVNEPELGRALDYGQRHEAIAYLRSAGLGDRIDEPLQVSLDLLQASAAGQPCAVFDAALTTIEKVPIPFFAAALAVAQVPEGGGAEDRECDDLGVRLAAARAAATVER
jgi:serine/threonine protein kinase